MFSSFSTSGLFSKGDTFRLFRDASAPLPVPPPATRQENPPQPKRAPVAPVPAPVAVALPEAPKERKPRKVRIAPEPQLVREAKPIESPELKASELSEAPKLKVIADILHKPRKPSEMSGLWKKAREANIPGFNKMKKSELKSALGIEDEA